MHKVDAAKNAGQLIRAIIEAGKLPDFPRIDSPEEATEKGEILAAYLTSLHKNLAAYYETLPD